MSDGGLAGETTRTIPTIAAPPDANHPSRNILLCVNFARNSRITNVEILERHHQRGFWIAMFDGYYDVRMN
ncbi:MAG: hypothetical protein NTV49_14495 [Kiritimatiellaeota bacterium]|nr:hypothetical protein [Kiritimatiellota bacterium]